MSKLNRVRIGKYIDVLTDYHANGSYESLKENVTLYPLHNYAIMIRTLNFERNDFSEDLVYIDEHAYDYLEKSKVYPNDILINKIANPGSIYIMPNLRCPVSCGMNLFLIRFNSQVNQRYMYYCMKNSESYIKSLTHGTSTKTITKDEVRDLFLYMHEDIKEQNKIEKLLTSIDKKIQLNNKINETLQEQAQDIYMHLFFRKTPNGKIADVLLENEKSTIQVGQAKAATGNYPFFTSGEAIFEWKESLVGGRNAFLNTGGNADVKFYVGNAAYSTDTWCITAKNALSDYLYLFLSSIKVELNQKFFQGTGLKHLQKELLKDRLIYIPDEKEINVFNKTICPMFDMISEKTKETQELTRLRDWLLPMLMNGQATVAEEQKSVLQILENDTKTEQPHRFALWLQNQGLAARGDIDRQTLREIFDAMDEDDK